MTAPSHQARPWRWAPLVVLVVAAIALVVVLRGSGAHHYRVVFATAGQLVKGDRVRIGGTVGEVLVLEHFGLEVRHGVVSSSGGRARQRRRGQRTDGS